MLRQIASQVVHSWFAEATLDALGRTAARGVVAKYDDSSLFPPIRRTAFTDSVPIHEPVLEIGPFDRPWLSGPSVRYFDVLSQEELKARAKATPGRNPDGCPYIDYVSPTGDLSIVDSEFSAVFSSHCIEHQPDLIRHLRDVGNMLRSGGSYYLIVPDKRFCFDHFLSESKVEEVRNAKGRTLHTERAVADHALATTHNNYILHWLGFHGHQGSGQHDAPAVAEEALKRVRRGDYVDVHAWQFTPTKFREVIQQLFNAGEIELAPLRVHNTGFGRIEFMAVLNKHAA